MKNRKIDIIKVDIEGHEDYFMKGAKETLRTHRPIILTEVNKPYYETRKNSLDEIFFPIIPPNYKIFKFEEGLENIVKKLGFEIKEKFPHLLNIPEILNLPKPNYSKMLTPYLVETINSKYEKDFEIFGYEMLNPNNIT